MRKNSLFILFSTIFLSLLVYACSNFATLGTTSMNIRIPVNSIVENVSEQSFSRAVIKESDSIYELKITVNIDDEILIQSATGTPEALSNKVFTFSDLQVGVVAVVNCDISKENNLIWTGKSESIVISSGTNNIEIKMKRVAPPASEGTIEPDYSEISLLLVSSENNEIPKAGSTYKVAPKQKIKVSVKDSADKDITSTLKSSTITLYQNGEEVTVKSSDKAIFIPHDAVGTGYTLRITVTTSSGVSYDKMVSIDIIEDLEIPESDKLEYDSL